MAPTPEKKSQAYVTTRDSSLFKRQPQWRLEYRVEKSVFPRIVGLKHKYASESPGGHVKAHISGPYSQSLWFIKSEVRAELRIPNKLPGDADGPSLENTLGEPLP